MSYPVMNLSYEVSLCKLPPHVKVHLCSEGLPGEDTIEVISITQGDWHMLLWLESVQ